MRLTLHPQGRHRPTAEPDYRPAFSYRPTTAPLVETWEQARRNYTQTTTWRSHVKKILGAVGLTLAAALGVNAVVASPPADAKPAKATYSCGTCVAPITCSQEDSCVLDYRNGAWYARQSGGSVWVRMTMVGGQ